MPNNLPPAYQKRMPDGYPINISSRPRRNWENIRRFTPEDYAEYCQASQWELDDPKFNNEQEYVDYYCDLVKNLVTSSKAVIGRWQLNGKSAAKAIETNIPASVPVFDFNSAMAFEPLPIAISQIHEKVALLSSNPPRPQYSPQQESQKQYVAAMNTMAPMVLEANNWEQQVSRGYYDIQFWNTCIYKWCVDPFKPGLFAEPGEISLELCEPDRIYWDPAAKALHYKYMDYIVQEHTLEIGEIQSQYPLAAGAVQPDFDEKINATSVQTRNNEDYIQSPQPKLARDATGYRQKITVYECYIKDSRTKFEPKIINGVAPDYIDRFQTDKNGYIIGDWVKRYPDGRLLVVTASAVLKDCPNPYPHGQFPYVFASGMPSTTPCTTGNASRIMSVTRKINNIFGKIHQYLNSEIGRPMHRAQGAVLDPNLAQQVPNDPSDIIDIKEIGMLVRPPAQDVPNNAFTYLNSLHGLVDMTSGSSGVMRGQLEEGAQLSAEAMGQLQQFASSRLALEARFFNVAVKQLAYQLMWLLRATVKQNLKMTVTMPDGSQEEINWESDRKVFESGDATRIANLRAREDYLVTIKAGTGSPGAQQQQQASSLALFNDGAIDRKAFLDSMEYPDRQSIVDRMRSQELEDIQTKAFGKALGVSVNEEIKGQDKPGRREKI